MTDLLIIGAIAYAVLVPAFCVAWYRSRTAKRSAAACEFPGCIAARAELRRLAIQHASDGIPSGDVLDVVEGVEAHEHR
jgi:hypothetical protein